MSEREKCADCDRSECRVGELFAAGDTDPAAVIEALRVAMEECHAHRVDWRARSQAAEAGVADLTRTFELRWKADMRAVARWRKGHPERELTIPDHADLCVWLLEEADKLEQAVIAATEQPGRFETAAAARSGPSWARLAIVESEVKALRERGAVADAALGFMSPWPVTDVLRKLAAAATHLLTEHDCAQSEYELTLEARDRALKMAAAIEEARKEPA